jgi:hypothetical protein
MDHDSIETTKAYNRHYGEIATDINHDQFIEDYAEISYTPLSV